MACARGECWWISRLNVSRLSQAVEGLELVFGERFGGRGVDCGVAALIAWRIMSRVAKA